MMLEREIARKEDNERERKGKGGKGRLNEWITPALKATFEINLIQAQTGA